MKRARWSSITLGVFLALAAAASCKESSRGQLGSETNWLGHCGSSSDCGRGTCLCGICTVPCVSGATCSGAVCVEKGSRAYVSACGLSAVVLDGICAAPCTGARSCSNGMSCEDGACVASAEPMDAAMPPDGPSGMDLPDGHADSSAPDSQVGGGGADAQGECTPDTLTTSDEAQSAVEASPYFSAGSHLIYVFGPSGGGGDMTSDGRSAWHLVYAEQPATRADMFDVCGSAIAHHTQAFSPAPGSCDGEHATALPSSIVVPDAWDRVMALATYDRTYLTLDQQTACMRGDGTRVQQVGIRGTRLLGPGGGVASEDQWVADYRDDGVLARLCGPCADLPCMPCTDAPSAPFRLDVARAGGPVGGCISFEQGALVQDATGVDGSGQLSNPNCVVAMVTLGDGAYFVAGPSFDVDLATPDADGDSVRHSTDTAEDRVKNGTFTMKVFPLDGLGDSARLVWSGDLFVGSVDARAGRAWFAATPAAR